MAKGTMRRVATALAVAAAILAGTGPATAGSPAQSHRLPPLSGRLLIAPAGELTAADPDGGNRVRFGAFYLDAAAWSPTADRVAFSTLGRSGVHDGITIAGADASNRYSIPTGLDEVRDVTWSPDGRSLAFVGCSIPATGCDVYRIRVRAPYGAPVRLTHGRSHPVSGVCRGRAVEIFVRPAWRPVGGSIAVDHGCWSPGDAQPDSHPVLIAASDGRELRRYRGKLTDPDWSPDGRRLLWTERFWDDGGPTGLVRMAADGSGRSRVTAPPRTPSDWARHASTGRWNSAGTLVSFDGTGSSSIFVTDPSGGLRQRLPISNAGLWDWGG